MLGVGLLVALALPSGDALADSSSPAAPARVRLVKSAAAPEGRLIAATVAPVNRATISTRLAASVQRVLANEGAKVKRGQLLVVLSASDVRAQLAAAATALANAEAYERRIAELVRSHAATPVELEAAQAQRAQATAAVAATQTTMAYTQLLAPFDGTVQARRVSAGDFVGPGQPLVDVEGAQLELQATLSQDEAAGLAIGQPVMFETNDQRGEAVVTALTTGADALSHRRTLRAKVTAASPNLRSGAFARIMLAGGAATHTMRVPQSAIVQRGDLTGVFIATDGRARLRWLSVGDVLGNDVLVRAGLASGEAVIDSPGALRDDDPIEIAPGARQ
jgi:RND family efflux transporter MFP subunit